MSGSSLVGGITGYNDGAIITGTFWDKQSSGQTAATGGGFLWEEGYVFGRTTSQMKMRSTFTSSTTYTTGWDFVGETINGPNDIWFMRPSEYPRLTWEDNKPVANAGGDETVYAPLNNIAQVQLDAAASSDADSDPLTYHWTWSIGSDNHSADGVSPTIELPVGIHTITLAVSDGILEQSIDDTSITVIAPLECKLKITPQTINRRSNQPFIQATVELPTGGYERGVDATEILVVYPGTVNASKQVVTNTGISAEFDKSALMAELPDNSDIELKVAGKLKSGQYFYGTDTIRIIGQKLK